MSAAKRSETQQVEETVGVRKKPLTPTYFYFVKYLAGDTPPHEFQMPPVPAK